VGDRVEGWGSRERSDENGSLTKEIYVRVCVNEGLECACACG
jgi:hypothetical protein